jgi:hypothetical protein
MQTVHPWRAELRALLSKAGVSEAVIDAADQKFHEALCADPVKRLSVEDLLSIESNFRDFEEDYGVAWNSRTGDYETFTGPNRTAIVLAYANRIYNQDLTPLADEASNLIFEAWVPEDVFEQACEILGRVKRQWVFEPEQAAGPAADLPWWGKMRALLAETGLEGELLEGLEEHLRESVLAFMSEQLQGGVFIDAKGNAELIKKLAELVGDLDGHQQDETEAPELSEAEDGGLMERTLSRMRERIRTRMNRKPLDNANVEHFATSDPQLTDLLNLAVDICTDGGNMDSALLLQSRLEAVETRLAKVPPTA